MEKKQRHRDNVAFQDYREEARKVYKRQLREMQPDLEAYERQKMAAIERAAASGGLELVETNDGEIVAVDKHGTFYSSADSTDFVENKPDRAAVDKLVNNLKKAEEIRLKKRRERRGEDEPDVTYINEKNKQFNQKLARFYNKVCTCLVRSVFYSANSDTVHYRDSRQFRAWNRSVSGICRAHGFYNNLSYSLSHYSIVLRHALVARFSIFLVPRGPLTDSSSMASTTAWATTSAFSGFSTIVPASGFKRPPKRPLSSEPIIPPRAIGKVIFRLESYRNPGRTKTLRSSGSCDAIVSSASRFVVMYRLGRIGAPPAAEMNTNVGTFSLRDSCASAMADSVVIYSLDSRTSSCKKEEWKIPTRISVHHFIRKLPIPFLWSQLLPFLPCQRILRPEFRRAERAL